MILEATHNPFLYSFFRLYTRLRIWAAFREVRIEGDIKDKGLPVLVFANHMSWWDGFWVMYMNMKLFRRKFWFMMLEEQLKKLMFFNKMGGYSVKKGSRSVVESIKYTIGLLEDERNMVLIFPQGRIESMHRKELVFEKGAARIAEGAGKAQILFVVNLVEYYSHARPTLYFYLAEYNRNDPAGIENAYNEFYRSALVKHFKSTEEE